MMIGSNEQHGVVSTSDENNDMENKNLVNLINNDLEEDESTDDDDVVIFDNKNADINKMDEDIVTDRLNEEDNHDIDSKIMKYEINNEDDDRNQEVISSVENNEVSSDVSRNSSTRSLKDSDENENVLNNSEHDHDDSSKLESDDSLSNVTDISDKLDDDDEDNNGRELVIPNINILKNTDTSSSSDDTTSSKVKEKRKKIYKELREVKARLEDESKISENIRIQLREERDARERLESNLSELQWKFDKQLKEEEELRHQLHKKDELNSILEGKELELIQELVEVKTRLSESLDNQRMLTGTEDTSYPPQLESVNEKLILDVNELQCKLEVSETLRSEKNRNIELLNEELIELKRKLYEFEVDKGEEEIPSVENAPPDSELQEKIKNMVEAVIGDSRQKLQIKDLEEEVENLKKKLEENKDKYSSNLAEALSTLKQVQNAYGDMRDVVLEGYKEEISTLQDRVRIAEEKSNEDLITALRQELLDARLQQERTKQACKDEAEISQKKFDECDSRRTNLSNEIESMKTDLENKEVINKSIQESLHEAQKISDKKGQIVEELGIELSRLKDTIEEKEGLISELKTQLLKEAEMLTKEHAEKEALQVELELLESVKRQNQRLEEEIEEMSHKVKLRGTKIKFLKKHIKELEEQKQKAESLMLVIPEMQKKIDALTNEKDKLRQEIDDKYRQEEESKRKIEEERKEGEERVQKEKEMWEKRILGIGKCLEHHEEDQSESNGIVSRPNSAPLLKPRPPTAKRHVVKNSGKSSLFRAPTLNPAFLHSYPEGRKATQKMKQHQEKIILSSQNRDNLFRSVTKPINYSNATFKHISEGKYFPKISPRSKDNFAPRVLVWGNGDGNKMVAVGDRVLTNINSDCSTHGQCSKQKTGVVKFIGFVEGNDDDVYIGLRLEEEVGYTDGMIQGKRYFRSEREKGAFVHLEDIVEVLETQAKHVPTLTA